MMTRQILVPVVIAGVLLAGSGLAIGCVFAPQQSEATQQQEQRQPEEKPVYDEEADAHVDIANALKKAKQENRRVLIQWGANWCGWCRLLDGTFKSNREVARKLQYEYDLVHVDIGKWDKHLDLVEKYGADIKSAGVPYLTILDADGNVLANQETGTLEKTVDGKPGHDPEKIVAFLAEHQAAYRKAADVLKEGLATAVKENKRVFLHFGAPWCGWCHKLEDWMARPDIAKLLATEFVDVKIDVDRTIGGKELDETFRESKDGGIPWFAFLDAEGKVLVTSDGPSGNIGFPVTDEEVAHFIDMLKDATRNLSAQDIDKIEQSLREPAKKQDGADGAGH